MEEETEERQTHDAPIAVSINFGGDWCVLASVFLLLFLKKKEEKTEIVTRP